MEDCYEGEVADVRFFHICTDGECNGIVHTCPEDYHQATVIAAINAFRRGVRIVCFCHMSTHSHFVVHCSSSESAVAFADGFKRDYARYVYLAHGVSGIYRRVASTPKEISDVYYLKRCIAYVLLNPVAARVTVRPEDYPYSSFDAYFTRRETSCLRVEEMGVRDVRKVFHTRVDLKESGFEIDSDGLLLVRSFLDYKLVESLFRGRTEFFRQLAITDSAVEELEYVRQTVRFDDNELYAEAAALSARMFRETTPALLTRENKLKLMTRLLKKTGVSPGRCARILRLDWK